MAAGHRADSRTLAVEENLLSTADAARLSFEVTASFALNEETPLERSMVSAVPSAGTVRFTIQDRLGAGGMGVVYRAFDRDRGETVALKTMRRIDPLALYRFKNEFRTLADLTHPNLVNLFELIAVGDLWFFTMEVIDGVDLVSFVRQDEALPASPGADDPETSRRRGLTGSATPCGNWPKVYTRCTWRASCIATSSQPTSWSPGRTRRAARLRAGGEPGKLRHPLTTPTARSLAPCLTWRPNRRWECPSRPPATGTAWASCSTRRSPAGFPLREPRTRFSARKPASIRRPRPTLVADVPEELVQVCMELLNSRSGKRPRARNAQPSPGGGPIRARGFAGRLIDLALYRPNMSITTCFYAALLAAVRSGDR